MRLGIDFSPTFVGVQPDAALFRELADRYDLRRTIIACGDVAGFAAWADVALTAGWTVEAYLELPNGVSLPGRIQAAGDTLLGYQTGRLWLAYEDTSLPLPTLQSVLDSIDAGNAVKLPLPCGIYSGAWYWPQYLGYDVSEYAPLWTAHYTNTPPDANTGFDVSYGGWIRAACVQYAGDVSLAGMNVDLDAWDE